MELGAGPGSRRHSPSQPPRIYIGRQAAVPPSATRRSVGSYDQKRRYCFQNCSAASPLSFSASRQPRLLLSPMKLTCLSKGGGGYHFPACHMLEVCGLRLLLECPLDLSAIAAFAPLPTAAIASRLDASCGLISAVPWYKAPKNLHLWDPALIDAVLLSTPTAMLGLPYLTRHPKFSAKIYATEATARIGRLMMEELLAMHVEFVRFYGLDERLGFPEWMKWEKLEKLPPEVKKVVMGEDGEELGSWLSLYR